jgi:hypothetical protein
MSHPFGRLRVRWGASPMTTRDGQHAIEKTYRIERFFADAYYEET